MPRCNERAVRLAFSIAILSWLSLDPAPAAGFFHAGSPLQNPSAEDHAERGLELARAGQLGAAEDELEKAVALQPGSAALLKNLGTVLAMEAKLPESTAIFLKALKISPGDLGVRGYLAANLWQLHRLKEARQHLEFILKARPGDPQATLLLGMVSENSGDYQTAVRMLASVPELVRGHPESVAALARSYYRTGEPQKARGWLEELRSGGGGVRGALLGAQIADQMEDYATAESLLVSLHPGAPEENEVNYRLAVVKFHAGEFAACRMILEPLAGKGVKKGEVLRLLGWCYQREGRYEDALHAFQEAIRMDPTDQTNFVDLGNMLVAEHRYSAALELARRMVGAFPDSARAAYLEGSVELQAEQFTDAVRSFRRARELDPANEETTIALARALAGAGEGAQAGTILREAMRRTPGDAALKLEMARLLLKEGEAGNAGALARAEQLLAAALAADPNLADAHYLLGDIALRRGKAAEAVAHLEKAGKLAPGSARTHFALSRAYRRLGRNEEAGKEILLYETLSKKEPPGAAPAAEAPRPNR